MIKAIKAEIYPNTEQRIYINRLLGCCRFVYNKCLDYRDKSYKDNGLSISDSQSISYIVSLKDKYPFLKEVHSKVLQQSVRNLNTAFNNFFKHPEHFSYPQFKSKKEYKDSGRFPSDAFIGIRGNRIDLIRQLKDILFKCSKRDEKYLNKRQNCIRNVTIIHSSSDRYFISILVDYKDDKINNIEHKGDGVIGIDMGLKYFAITSNGETFENKNFYKNEYKKIKHLQRSLSRKSTIKKEMADGEIIKINSKRREKVKIRLARVHEKIKNKRHNYIDLITTQLVSENQVICVENLNVKGMIRNHNLALNISDVGWGEFFSMLERKCNENGRLMVKIDRWYPSSKTCHSCGYIKKDLTLKDREWICPVCGEVIDRDYNAALNIRDEGLKILKEPNKNK